MRKRIDLIDCTRGFCLICMVFYHFLFNIVNMFDLPSALLYNPILNLLQIVFAAIFIIICGISSNFSKNNIRRGFQICAAALLVTIVTYSLNNVSYVKFGILHFLGVSTLLFGLIKNKFDKLSLNKWVAPILILLFILTRDLLLIDFNSDFLFIFGIMSDSFTSLDYFPIIPWIFIFFAGAYLGKYIKIGLFPRWFYTVKCKPLSVIGKHSLLIYVLHQPILTGLTILFVYLKGH